MNQARPLQRDRSASFVAALCLAAASTRCTKSPTGPSGDPPARLPPRPVLVTPANGTDILSDRPTFTVQNARGFDAGAAQYTVQVLTVASNRTVATATVAAGAGTTSITLPEPLPRGMALAWRATARGGAGESVSDTSFFRVQVEGCQTGVDPYAKRVLDSFLTPCSRANNIYNDPEEVLGPPDAGGFGQFNYTGFFSLGEGGYVTVDMGGCVTDEPGADVRVFQAVGSEPVTLYASGSPSGPFYLLEARKRCGDRIPGSQIIRYCDFDLAPSELQQARYFKIEDGELFPCERAETPSEGTDIDAIQILHGTATEGAPR